MSQSSGSLLKIYSSQDVLPRGLSHVPMLYPFWGLPKSERSPDTYARYVSIGAEAFRLVNANDADVFILPFDWRYTTRAAARSPQEANTLRTSAARFAERAAELDKRVVVFYIGDTDEEVPLPNAITFRTSMIRGQRLNEFAMTVFFDDFPGRTLAPQQLSLRPKFRRPTVGFCGFAGYRLMPDISLRRKVRRVARWVRDGFPNPTVRELAISELRRNRSVIANFVLSEHGKGRIAYDEEAQDVFRRNVLNSDYTLCARGAGNWSIRFYETLAFGRIPLFIDTQNALPYDFDVDYRDCTVWVEAEDVKRVGDTLAEFHDSIDESSFSNLQRLCRRVWEERLTPEGYFSNFYRHFELRPPALT